MNKIKIWILCGVMGMGLFAGTAQNKELIAVRYGISLFPAEAVFYGHTGREKVPFHWLLYVIRSGNRVILVDTGFEDPKMTAYFKIAIKPVPDCLREAGILPENVTDVIITHTHFDHVGTVHRFPNARVVIQKDEYEHFLKNGADKTVVQYLKNKKELELFTDETAIDGWIRIRKIGGHTVGSSVVELILEDRKILLAGDEVYLPDNWQKKIPVGTFYHHSRNKAFILTLPGDYESIYLFHDPELVTGRESFRKLYP